MSLQRRAQAVNSRKIVGATGLEPVTVESEDTETTRLAERGKVDADTSPKNPLEKMAEAWETLTPEVQAKIAELVEQIIEKA